MSNEFCLYDPESGQATPWSKSTMHAIPKRFLARKEIIQGAVFLNKMICLWGSTYLCFIDPSKVLCL